MVSSVSVHPHDGATSVSGWSALYTVRNSELNANGSAEYGVFFCALASTADIARNGKTLSSSLGVNGPERWSFDGIVLYQRHPYARRPSPRRALVELSDPCSGRLVSARSTSKAVTPVGPFIFIYAGDIWSSGFAGAPAAAVRLRVGDKKIWLYVKHRRWQKCASGRSATC